MKLLKTSLFFVAFAVSANVRPPPCAAKEACGLPPVDVHVVGDSAASGAVQGAADAGVLPVSL